MKFAVIGVVATLLVLGGGGVGMFYCLKHAEVLTVPTALKYKNTSIFVVDTLTKKA